MYDNCYNRQNGHHFTYHITPEHMWYKKKPHFHYRDATWIPSRVRKITGCKVPQKPPFPERQFDADWNSGSSDCLEECYLPNRYWGVPVGFVEEKLEREKCLPANLSASMDMMHVESKPVVAAVLLRNQVDVAISCWIVCVENREAWAG